MARASDYFDGSASADEVPLLEEHLRLCDACGRYKSVYEQGTSLLRALPEPKLGDDFGPRLQHRLFHVDDRRALIDASGSATPGLTVLGLAVLLTAVAWSPLLREAEPVVELSPIVVDHVHAPVPPPASAVGFASTRQLDALHAGLWEEARLYEYTRLSKRYTREDVSERTGFDD